MREELLKGLTPDQIEKAKACDDVNDLLQLAKDEEVKLTDEQLRAISGGCGDNKDTDKDRPRKIESKNPGEMAPVEAAGPKIIK